MPYRSISLIIGQPCSAENIPSVLNDRGYPHCVQISRAESALTTFLDAVEDSDRTLGYWTVYTTEKNTYYYFRDAPDAVWARLVL